jgi:flagellar motility protein MotE (MotC chaperone)
MQLIRMSVLAAAGALALLSASPLAAQGPGQMMDERGWGMGWGMWWDGPWGRGPDGMLDRVEGRLAFVKAELQITEAQAPAWNQLADAVRAAAKNHNERMRAIARREERNKTLPERLEAQEQRVTARLEEIRQIKSSLSNLYAVLSDAQKKEADDIVLPMTGMYGMMGYRRGWRD